MGLRCLTGRRQGLPQFHLFHEEGHVLGGLLVIAQAATAHFQEVARPGQGVAEGLIRLVDQGGGLEGEAFLSVAGGGIEVRVDSLAEKPVALGQHLGVQGKGHRQAKELEMVLVPGRVEHSTNPDQEDARR